MVNYFNYIQNKYEQTHFGACRPALLPHGGQTMLSLCKTNCGTRLPDLKAKHSITYVANHRYYYYSTPIQTKIFHHWFWSIRQQQQRRLSIQTCHVYETSGDRGWVFGKRIFFQVSMSMRIDPILRVIQDCCSISPLSALCQNNLSKISKCQTRLSNLHLNSTNNSSNHNALPTANLLT